jgi:peptidoglycan hydrolase-like protein with peptidoglycan-binding domain
MGIVILILFALLALSSVNGCDSINGDGEFDWGVSDEATASDGTSTSDGTSDGTSTSDGLPTCDGVVVISVDSESVRVPGDTGVFSSASSACGMSEGRGSEDAVVVLQDALTRCNREEVAADGEYGAQTAAAVADVQRRAGITADGEYGPATLEAMRWPTTSTSGGTDCVAGPSSGTTGGGSSSLPPTD